MMSTSSSVYSISISMSYTGWYVYCAIYIICERKRKNTKTFTINLKQLQILNSITNYRTAKAYQSIPKHVIPNILFNKLTKEFSNY